MTSVNKLVTLSFCASIIFVTKLALIYIPNVEMVTFLLMIFAMVFTLKEALLISTTYTIVEILLWRLTEQAYIWTVIILVTWLFKSLFKDNFVLWAMLAAFYGITFGFFSAIPILIMTNFETALAYFIGGLWFDAVHMVGNYLIMLFLGGLVYKNLQRLLVEYYK